MTQTVLIPTGGRATAIGDARALRDLYEYSLETGEMDPGNPVPGRIAAAIVQAAADGEDRVELDTGDATILATARDRQATIAIQNRDPDTAEAATKRAETIIHELYDQDPAHHERMLTMSGIHVKYAPEDAPTTPQELTSTLNAPAELYDRGFNERIDELLTGIEGVRPRAVDQHGTLVCDRCNDTIPPQSRIGMYYADVDLASPDDETRQLILHRLYCSECNPPRIRYPCRGVSEILVSGAVARDYRFTNLSLRQAAGRDEGFNWDPRETAEEIFGQPFDRIFDITGPDGSDWTYGPEDVVDQFELLGIDFRKYLDEEGNVTITDDQRREELEQAQQVISRVSSQSRSWQRDLVNN